MSSQQASQTSTSASATEFSTLGFASDTNKSILAYKLTGVQHGQTRNTIVWNTIEDHITLSETNQAKLTEKKSKGVYPTVVLITWSNEAESEGPLLKVWFLLDNGKVDSISEPGNHNLLLNQFERLRENRQWLLYKRISEVELVEMVSKWNQA